MPDETADHAATPGRRARADDTTEPATDAVSAGHRSSGTDADRHDTGGIGGAGAATGDDRPAGGDNPADEATSGTRAAPTPSDTPSPGAAGAGATAGPSTGTSARSRWPRVATLTLILLVLCACAAVAVLHHRDRTSGTTPTASGTPFPLALPPTLTGGFTLVGPTASPTPRQNADGSAAVTGTYQQDGRRAVVVMVSRPASAPEAFLTTAGFHSLAQHGTDAWCGTGVDPNAPSPSPTDSSATGASSTTTPGFMQSPTPSASASPAATASTTATATDVRTLPYQGCAVVRDQTAILTVGTLDQDADQLATLVQQFAAQLTQH